MNETTQQHRDERFKLLTDRELTVMRWIGEGYSTAEIGSWMGIAQNTVHTYKALAAEKLHINGATYRTWAFKVAAGLI